ncbi:MGDG synthase family glycosyltransferase [Streptomyces odontomachi]|uniref:MGDG synthase family glycosyltransferase n=1 Tax=Streptomyces odontomachi TaxID=2944940 RepID=UPI002108C3EF|nr:galactosyldiacylglycerol synthase [Streptomyces sp. ODS25]
MAARFLILSAGMGSGHDAVAAELARRLQAAGHHTARADVLELFPAGVGSGLRSFYRTAVGRLPALYAGVYATFLRPGHGPRPGSAPLAALADQGLLALVRRERPDVVVATFHLAAQLTGRLRARGALRVPSAVVVTDFAVNRQWLHRGNDIHLCLTSSVAERVRRAVARPAVVSGPLVGERFLHPPGGAQDWGERLCGTSGGPVLVSAGAWGVGTRIADTARLVSAAGFLPIVLCGDNPRLRRALARVPGALAPGWVDDMPGLMGACRVLIDNAAGQTALEALAMGLPVVGYRPIPGHGVAGVRAMAALGLSDHPRDSWSLLRSLDTLAPPGPARDRRIAAGRALLVGDVVRQLESLAGGGRPPPAPETGARHGVG